MPPPCGVEATPQSGGAIRGDETDRPATVRRRAQPPAGIDTPVRRGASPTTAPVASPAVTETIGAIGPGGAGGHGGRLAGHEAYGDTIGTSPANPPGRAMGGLGGRTQFADHPTDAVLAHGRLAGAVGVHRTGHPFRQAGPGTTTDGHPRDGHTRAPRRARDRLDRTPDRADAGVLQEDTGVPRRAARLRASARADVTDTQIAAALGVGSTRGAVGNRSRPIRAAGAVGATDTPVT